LNEIKKFTTKKRGKITIQSRIRLDFEDYFLDLYALKKYKKYYNECNLVVENKRKNQVDEDIIILTEKYNVTKVADVRLLLMAQLLSTKEKNIILSDYLA
jgi:hypothetical protein